MDTNSVSNLPIYSLIVYHNITYVYTLYMCIYTHLQYGYVGESELVWSLNEPQSMLPHVQ